MEPICKKRVFKNSKILKSGKGKDCLKTVIFYYFPGFLEPMSQRNFKYWLWFFQRETRSILKISPPEKINPNWLSPLNFMFIWILRDTKKKVKLKNHLANVFYIKSTVIYYFYTWHFLRMKYFSATFFSFCVEITILLNICIRHETNNPTTMKHIIYQQKIISFLFVSFRRGCFLVKINLISSSGHWTFYCRNIINFNYL